MKKILFIALLLSNFIEIKLHASDSNQPIIQEINGENNLRADASKPTSTWMQPLIIDANNHQFDTIGTFKLSENITYKPASNYAYPPAYINYPAAIIIAKDNITIDLAGFTLSLSPSSSNFLINKPIYGIAVLPGVKNVKIISTLSAEQKGCIFGFSGFAIYMLGTTTTSYGTYDIYANMIKNVIINNLLITQNMNGIYISNALEVSITNMSILYNFSPRILYGINFVNVLEGLIDSCKINQNYSYSDVYGICLQDTIGVVIENSATNLNQSTQYGDANGMNITASTATTSHANQISNCTAHRNFCSFSTGKNSIGFSIDSQSHHNTIENCSSFGNSHSTTFGGAPAPVTYPQGIGFQLDSTNSNRIHNNKSGQHDTYGFYDTQAISTSFWTSNLAILNPTANYNITIPTHAGSQPLPTIVLSQNNLTAYTGTSPVLANIEVQVP